MSGISPQHILTMKVNNKPFQENNTVGQHYDNIIFWDNFLSENVYFAGTFKICNNLANSLF